MYLDTFLIAQAESLANGRYIHKVQNMVAAYRSAYELAIDENPAHVAIFLIAQKDLRKFINQRRLEKTDVSEYALDRLKND